MSEVWLSIAPFVIAIVLAVWLKQIIPPMLIGLWIGSFLLTHSLLGSVETTVGEIIVAMSDPGNLDILLFLYTFGGMVGQIQVSGGVQAFSRLGDKIINSERKTLLAPWLLLPVTFIDCAFRVIATGSILKPFARKFGVPQERLAFMLNHSSVPVLIFIPFATTLFGFVFSMIDQGMTVAGAEGSVFSLFVRSLPFQFFGFASILVALFSIIPAFRMKEKSNPNISAYNVEFASEFGNEGKAETTADQLGTAMNIHKDVISMEHDHETGEDPVLPPRILNLIIPLVVLLGLSVYFMWTSGDLSRSMVVAIFIAAGSSEMLYLLQGAKLKTMVDSFFKGANQLMMVVSILALAWPISNVSQDLGLITLIQSISGGIQSNWLPVLTFIVTGFIAYLIGSSWATWALLMPIVILFAVVSGGYLPIVVAAVLSGGIFGDVTSPVSGMSAMSAAVAGAGHRQTIKTMMPYNMVAAAVTAILFAFIPFVIL